MIDATAYGANHVQIMHVAGMSAHSVLLTRNEALTLVEKLRVLLAERQDDAALIPDD